MLCDNRCTQLSCNINIHAPEIILLLQPSHPQNKSNSITTHPQITNHFIIVSEEKVHHTIYRTRQTQSSVLTFLSQSNQHETNEPNKCTQRDIQDNCILKFLGVWYLSPESFHFSVITSLKDKDFLSYNQEEI